MKKFLKLVGALLTLVILALLTIPFFISADMLKTQLAAQVKKTTGRELVMTGPVSLKLFPNIALKATDVTLGNPAGFRSEYLVKIGTLETGLALKPLLNGNVEVNGLLLDGAVIHLEELASGTKNWDFAAKKKAAEPGAGPKKSKVKSLKIGTVTIHNSAVEYRKAGEKTVALKAIDLTLNGADGSAPLELDGSAEYRGERTSISLDMKDSKGFLKGGASPTVLALALPGATVDFNGTAQNSKGMAANGNLVVEVVALPTLQAWATGKKPAANGPQKLALKGPVEFHDNRIAFSKFNATVDDLSTHGTLAVQLGGARPKLNGALNFDVLDMNALQKKSSSDAAPKTEGWSREPIDFSGLKALDAALHLNVAGIKTGALNVGATALEVKIKDGALDLGIEKMALYGGNAHGAVGASAAGIRTDLDIAGVKIEPLMEALSGKSRLRGTANIGLNLRGAGNSQQAIVNTLNGEAKLRFTDGAIKGINVAKFLRTAKQGFLTEGSEEVTDFSELSASFQVANGVASNSDLAMKAPLLRLSGKGSINLPLRTINYRAIPSVVGTTKGQGGKDLSGLNIPLIITGPWSKINVTPDLAGMVEEGLKDPKKIENTVKDVGKTVKNIGKEIKNYNSPEDLLKLLGK